MVTFEQYVLDWWSNYLSEQDESKLRTLMENLIGEEESVEDYVPQDYNSVTDWLLDNMTADEIYKNYFVDLSNRPEPDNMPEPETFIKGMLEQNVSWPDGETRFSMSFADDYISDMAYNITKYDTPYDFFTDLAKYGVQSGMIGMLIYNYDCKNLYIEHINDMESYKEDLEEYYGDSIKNRDHLPHYTFVTWLVYEDLAWRIAGHLYPENF